VRPRRGSSGPTVGPEQIVERALNQTQPGVQEHRFRKTRFDEAYGVWRGLTSAAEQRRRAAKQDDGVSRLRVKYGMQVIDQALVNLVQGVPRAKVTPRVPDAEHKAEAAEKLLGYYGDLDHLAEKEPVICQQALIYGISPCKNHWLYCEDQQGNVTDDRPTMEPWDAYSIWWDPVASTVDECAYVVLESWKTKPELEQGRFNEDDGTGQWRNLDLLYQSGDGPEKPQSLQDRVTPQPQGAYRGRFQLWEVWRRTAEGVRQTVIGNQKILLRDGPSPYRMYGYPITISNSRPDLFKIEGISESELVDHLQQAMWTVENLRMEQMKTTVMRAMSIRATVPDPDSIVLRPNARWLVNDHDDVMFHASQPLPPEAYTETQDMLSRLQYVTGINAYVSGASGNTSGVDQNTATGVSLLTQSASRLLTFKARQISERTWQRGFEQWYSLAQQFVKRPMLARVTGPGDTIDWVPVTPEDLSMPFDIRVEAGEDSALTSQQQASAIGLLNALAPFVQFINVPVLIERVGKAFGIPDPKTLIAPPQPPPVAAPTANGNGGGTPAMLGTGLAGIPSLAPHPAMSVLAGNQ